jgi:proteasome regulatory subunit
MLDRAILRPGRFDRLIEVPEPNHEGRVEILKIHSRRMSVADGVDYDALADLTEGYNGADIASIATEAGMFAIRDDRTTVRMEDFEDAVEKIESDGAAETVAGSYPDYAY